MKPFKTRLVCVLGTLMAGGTVSMALAEDKPNPYQAIIERNPFGLKPPPTPVDNTPPPPVVPLAKVVLTGITSMFHTDRALIEITEQEPGKPPTTRKPILREGERDGSVEVIAIDVEKSLVKIRNGGFETNLSFETPKLAGAPAGVALPGFPAPPLGASPNGFNPPRLSTNTLGRVNGVGVYGNNASPVPIRAVPPPYGGVPVTGATEGGLRSIPSRSMRADSAIPPLPPSPSRVPTR